MDLSPKKPFVKLADTYNLSMRAEIGYAYFNANRTLETGKTIKPELVETEFGFGLVDKNRPSNPYYNRIVISAHVKELNIRNEQLLSFIQAIEVQMPQQTTETSKKLLSSGWVPKGSLCYLLCQPNRLLEERQTVRKLDENESSLFFDTIGLPLEKRKPEFYCNNQFQCYLAYTRSGEVAGWATMYVGEGFVFLGNAETLHQHQRKGYHSAILAVRLNEVMKLDLGVAYTDVLPGRQSHMNCLAAGFTNLAVNQIWGRGGGT